MYVLVSYDVATRTKEGRRRLRRVARACEAKGQRVQYSLFECKLDPAEWVAFRNELLSIIDRESDSLRVYKLGRRLHERLEHHGAKPGYDVTGPLLV